MASSSRRQIETWLGTLEIKGRVADIGGLFWPAKGRTKTWDASQYDIYDVVKSRRGATAAYLWDFNTPFQDTYPEYDVAFCVEVTDHFWNPVVAFLNIWELLVPGGMLYVSSNFLFPHHTGHDCIRLTATGLKKILEEAGFEVLTVTPRHAAKPAILEEAMRAESKVYRNPGAIGFMVAARKL